MSKRGRDILTGWMIPTFVLMVAAFLNGNRAAAFCSCPLKRFVNVPDRKSIAADHFLLTARKLLFIGMSLDGVQTLVEPAVLEKNPARKHYLIVPRSEAPKRVDATFRRTSVRIFAYTDGDTQQICDFLNKLKTSEQARMAVATASSSSGVESA